MARPTKWEDIPTDEVLKLARLGCTNGEIGDFFGVSDETVRTRFLDILALGRANQRISLRRYQWKSARGGNVPMQIHLGKQYLGQSDKTDVTSGGKPVRDAEALIATLPTNVLDAIESAAAESLLGPDPAEETDPGGEVPA